MNTPTEPDKPRTARDYDEGRGERVEKDPKTPESPQQAHENEGHG